MAIFASMTMTYALLSSMPMFVCGVLTLLLLLNLLQRHRRSLVALTVFMATATLLYIGHCVFFFHETAFIPFTDTLYCFCNLLVYPLYYLYIRSLSERRSPVWIVVAVTMPAAVCGTLVGIGYLQMSPSDTLHFIAQHLYHKPLPGMAATAVAEWSHHLVRVMFMVELVPIVMLSFRSMNRYDKTLERYYSFPGHRRLTWVKLMLVLFVMTSIISMVSNLVGRHFFDGQTPLLAIPSILFSTLLFGIGYVGMKQQGIEDIEELREDELREDELKEDELREDELKDEQQVQPDAAEAPLDLPDTVQQDAIAPAQPAVSLRDRIEELMNSEQLFLNPHLKLNDLVLQLGTNRNYVYQAINVEMGVSFAEYVNRKRVDYAADLLVSQPQLSNSEVATRSGFATPVSYYRHFKNFKGCSPNDFRQEHLAASPV